MLAKTYSSAVLGVDAYIIEVEVNAIDGGEKSYTSVVGLPDTAVKESRERVYSAITSSGFFTPQGVTLVNLAPADVKKEGAAFDLPIALTMLATTGDVPVKILGEAVILGELALNGEVRSVKGVLPAVLNAKQQPYINAVIVPQKNAAEAAIAAGDLPVYGVKTLAEAVELLINPMGFSPYKLSELERMTFFTQAMGDAPDFQEVKGQMSAKRALTIVATGGHNCLMIGPPGTGKSMLAKRLPSILPPLTLDENLETSKIHSVLGMLEPDMPLLKARPFRSPHHTISDVGLLGGGQNPKPGEISLAHNGVLFLDEFPEFKRNVLEVMRQPLEDGEVTVSRAAGSFKFPAQFILVAAMNPCPCGHLGSTQRQCRCSSSQIQRYRNRLSGPLLDRIDIHIEVSSLSHDELLHAPAGESSESILKRVMRAREIQNNRFMGCSIHCNANMDSRHIQKYCQLDKESQSLLRHSIEELQLSARAYDRILRVARTIADLDGDETIMSEHINEAVQYRTLDRKLW